MNDNTSFERYVAEAFDREGPGRPVPDAIHDDLISRAGRQRQWPTWLAFVKEPPMRLTNSHAVGSPTVRVLATMAATLLLILAMAAAGIAGKNLLAADDTIVVDPEGNGDYTTITEAVAAAEDGDTVVLKAGTYPESVIVPSAITIRGEEPGTAVIEVGAGCTTDQTVWETTCPPEVPRYGGDDRDEGGPYGFALEGADATISDVRFHFHALADGVIVDGASVVLEGLSTSGEGDANDGALMVQLNGGADVIVEDSDLGDGWVLGGRESHMSIQGSTFGALVAEPATADEPHIIRDNQISYGTMSAGPIVIEGNVFELKPGVEGDSFIIIQGGTDWVIKDNTLSGDTSTYGAIEIQAPAGPGIIEDNTLSDNDLGILLGNDSLLKGNDISSGSIGIRLTGGSPELTENTITDMREFGVNMAFADPALSGNRLCDSAVDLYIGSGSEPVIADDNEICVTDSP